MERKKWIARGLSFAYALTLLGACNDSPPPTTALYIINPNEGEQSTNRNAELEFYRGVSLNYLEPRLLVRLTDRPTCNMHVAYDWRRGNRPVLRLVDPKAPDPVRATELWRKTLSPHSAGYTSVYETTIQNVRGQRFTMLFPGVNQGENYGVRLVVNDKCEFTS